MLRLLMLARLALWGFLVYLVSAGSREALVIVLAVMIFAIELMLRVSPVVIPMRPDRARHRRGSDEEA